MKKEDNEKKTTKKTASKKTNTKKTTTKKEPVKKTATKTTSDKKTTAKTITTKKNDNKKIEVKKEIKKEEKKSFFSKAGNFLRKKWLVSGAKTIILVVIIIAIYMGINMLLDKVILPELDVTKNKMYSVSQETKDKLKDIDKEVKITIVNFGDYDSLIKLIEKYSTVNKNITIDKIDDLSARNDLIQKYMLTATSNAIIIEAGDKGKALTENDLTTFDYTTYEQIDVAEESITNAILDVTVDVKPKIYFMKNHLMYDAQYFTGIMQSIVFEANDVEAIDLLAKGSVPEDCNVLIISTLKEDISDLERDKIIEYISKGGELLLLCGPNMENTSLANFQQVLDQYGMKISNGVVFEGNPSNMLSGYPDFIIEELTEGTALTKNLNMSMNICLADAAKITVDEGKLEELGVEYETIATTTSTAFFRTDIKQTSATKTQADEDAGNSIIAATATKKVADGKTSKIVIFANELMAMDYPIQINGYNMYTGYLYNNRDVVLNSISYLNEREDTITIRKTNESVRYTVTALQNKIILGIIFAVPVIIIILGIVIWQVRRRKK